MATTTPNERIPTDYDSCIVRPLNMDDDGPLIHFHHVLDAGIVGFIAFFAALGGDVLPTLLAGEAVYLTASEIAARLPMAGIAFGATFFAQWARYRGLRIRKAWNGQEKEET